MRDAIGATTLLALTFLPGAALVLAATRRGSRARYASLAASPALTMGLAGIGFTWPAGLGWRWSALNTLVLEVAVVGAAFALRAVWSRSARLARRFGPPGGSPPRSPRLWWRARRVDVAALAVALAAGIGVTRHLLSGIAYPPGWDPMNHGFMARRVLDLGSSLPSDICVTGSTLPVPSCHFYPLIPHVLWAQTSELTGVRLSTAMLATEWLVAPAAAVVAAFALVRVLGGRPWAACAAASAVGVLGPLAHAVYSGLVTMLLGAAISPGVALLAYVGVHYRRSRAVTAVSGVAAGGLLLAHTYDIVFAALLGVGLLVTRPLTRQRLRRLPGLALAMLAGAALVVGPRPLDLLRAGEVRGTGPPRYAGDLVGALGYWVWSPGRYVSTWIASVPDPSPGAGLVTAGVLIGVGMVVAVVAAWWPRYRWARPFAVLQVAVLALVLLVDAGSGPVREAVASLFYGDPRRVFDASLVAPAVLAVAGWYVIADLLTRRAAGRRRRAPRRPGRASRRPGGSPDGSGGASPFWPAATALVAAATAVAGVTALPVTQQTRAALARRAPADPTAYERTGEWLRDQLSSRDVVADDFHRDFVTWLDTDYGIGVLDGLYPLSPAGHADWDARQELWRRLTGAEAVPGEAPCLTDPYGVRFVVISAEHMPGGRRTYSPEAVRRSPYLRAAFSTGPLEVFRVVDTCPRDDATTPTAAAVR